MGKAPTFVQQDEGGVLPVPLLELRPRPIDEELRLVWMRRVTAFGQYCEAVPPVGLAVDAAAELEHFGCGALGVRELLEIAVRLNWVAEFEPASGGIEMVLGYGGKRDCF